MLALRNPKVKGRVKLIITEEELHDLKVIAGIRNDVLRQALKTSVGPWVDRTNNCQTHNIYGLCARLMEIE